MNFGSGRGALLRSFDFQSVASSSSSEKSSNDKSSDSEQPRKDSGLASTSKSTSDGRGQLLELSGTTTNENTGSISLNRPLGRGALFCSLSSGIAPSTIGGGRGSLFGLFEKPDPLLSKDAEEIKTDIKNLKIGADNSVKTSLTSDELNILDSEKKPINKVGSFGDHVKAACNYIHLKIDPNKGVFEYDVSFTPNIDSKNHRIQYLNQHRSKFGGTKTFDGATLFLPIMLPKTVTTYVSKNLADGSEIKIDITFKRKKSLAQCINLFNILFGRIMKTLNFVCMDRKHYDPTAPKLIPQHKLEVWPGYITTVKEVDGGVMLCCDVSHRILCSTTVLDIFEEIYRCNSSTFQEMAKKSLIGAVVLTRYNNRVYRIDDIDFKSNPRSTFRIGDKDVSFQEYYKQHYNIDITDIKQPLLISIKKRRQNNQDNEEELIFSLVPEICYITGLNDETRSNFKVMKDIATYTKVTPNQRALSLQNLIQKINGNNETKEILSDWGLTLHDGIIELTGRKLGIEKIFFGKTNVDADASASFGKYAVSSELLEVVNLVNWLLIFTNTDTRIANSFMDCLERCSRPMGIQIAKPKIVSLRQDRTEEYVKALRSNIKSETQIVVLICPTSRDDRYAAIKKVCCLEMPIPSQVINARTLKNESRNRSIVQKIALQMNCKLGGALWSVKIPFSNVMICGIDTYHNSVNRNNSVFAFVASLNNQYSKWYSRAVIQGQGEEFGNGICVCMQKALAAYKTANGRLPDRIIVYRDGVSDGQLNTSLNYEIPQLKAAFKLFTPIFDPPLTFIVVQKRISTRIFCKQKGNLLNPEPGFIVDQEITRPNMVDFFLVSPSVREGTVSPAHYIVLYDTSKSSPDIIQRLSYKLCFMYYNWTGTVRAPACCQYAHKLAYLIGQNVKRPASEKLSNLLYYL